MAIYKAMKNIEGFHLVFKYKEYEIMCNNSSHLDFESSENCGVHVDNHSIINCIELTKDNIISIDHRSLLIMTLNASPIYDMDENNVIDIKDYEYVP